jgi:hypothetical protein
MINCLFLTVLQTKVNARVYRCYVQLACGQFGHLFKKNFFSYPEFLETKCQRRKDVPYREDVPYMINCLFLTVLQTKGNARVYRC